MDDLVRLVENWRHEYDRGSSGFVFDTTSERSKAIRSAFASKETKAYAVGGKDKFSRWNLTKDIFGIHNEKEWIKFLLPHLAKEEVEMDAQNFLAWPEEDIEPIIVPRWIDLSVLDESKQRISSLQELALKSLIRDRKIPAEAILELAIPAPQEGSNSFEIHADQIPHYLFNHDLPGNDDRITSAIQGRMKWNEDSKWIYKLDKMQIYGPGGFSLPHADTCHAPNHIATVVVGLPMDYEGGELVVTHEGSERSFDLSNGIAYCAFFTGCTHEVREVASGYRIVLQYDVYEEVMQEAMQNSFPEYPEAIVLHHDHEGVLQTYHGGKRKRHDRLVWSWDVSRYLDGPQSNVFYSKINGSPEAAELAVLDYFSTLKEGDNVALLLQYHYPLLLFDAEVLKGSDAMVYNIFASSGRWKCTLQNLILRAKSDYYRYWLDDVEIRPISVRESEIVWDNSNDGGKTTHLVLYSNSKKATGNLFLGHDFDKLAHYACIQADHVCCLILTPCNNGVQNADE